MASAFVSKKKSSKFIFLFFLLFTLIVNAVCNSGVSSKVPESSLHHAFNDAVFS